LRIVPFVGLADFAKRVALREACFVAVVEIVGFVREPHVIREETGKAFLNELVGKGGPVAPHKLLFELVRQGLGVVDGRLVIHHVTYVTTNPPRVVVVITQAVDKNIFLHRVYAGQVGVCGATIR
jgi:hypothetical protein